MRVIGIMCLYLYLLWWLKHRVIMRPRAIMKLFELVPTYAMLNYLADKFDAIMGVPIYSLSRKPQPNHPRSNPV